MEWSIIEASWARGLQQVDGAELEQQPESLPLRLVLAAAQQHVGRHPAAQRRVPQYELQQLDQAAFVRKEVCDRISPGARFILDV